MGSHSLTLDLALPILGKETAVLDIKGAFSVVRGVTPAKLARAYNRLWESLDYQGDHRYLEGATQSTVSREMREFEEELERLEDGPDMWVLRPRPSLYSIS